MAATAKAALGLPRIASSWPGAALAYAAPANPTPPEPIFSIDYEAGPEEVVRRLVGAYLAGADEIHVKSATKLDPKARAQIRDVSRALVGVEIVEEGNQTMVLQDLVGVADMDLRKTLTRMQRIARL